MCGQNAELGFKVLRRSNHTDFSLPIRMINIFSKSKVLGFIIVFGARGHCYTIILFINTRIKFVTTIIKSQAPPNLNVKLYLSVLNDFQNKQ